MKFVFLAHMTTAFSGKTAEQKPMGGSESALFYLTRELARRGHAVTVFNNCGDEAGIYDGVEFIPFTTLHDVVFYSQKHKIDIFISFRYLPAFLFPIRAKKRIWWGHDDFSNVWYHGFPLNIFGSAFLRLAGFLTRKLCDELFVVSTWLGDICQKYLHFPKARIFVIRNGIYLPHFENLNMPRDPYRLIYSSVPDRGLDILLKIFPKIKAAVPLATLSVFCGLELGMLKARDKQRATKLYDLAAQPGVTLHGNVPHRQLAEALSQSALFVYPSHAVPAAAFYAETSCIAAIEAQAAGTPVIASRRGALPETVEDKKTGILISGDPYSHDYQDKFVDAVINLLKDNVRRAAMSEAAKSRVFSYYGWDAIAKEWEDHCLKIMS